MLELRRFDIKYVKGIGPGRASALNSELGIHNVYDLLHHFPNSYIDRSRIYRIRELAGIDDSDFPYVQLKGAFISFNVLGEGAKLRLVALFSDGSGTIETVWFKGIRNIRNSLRAGQTYILFGKPSRFNGTLQMTHPEVDSESSLATMGGVRAVYPLTERLRQKNIDSRVLHTAITGFLSTLKYPLKETLPPSVIKSEGLMGLDEAIRTIHMPHDAETLSRARQRLKFEELFYIQTDMLMRSRNRKASSQGYPMPHIGQWFNDFYKQCLPFELTGAQKRVIKEIHADIARGKQMNRLVQGDVGSGKTLVALLTGSTKTKERRIIDEQLRNGSLHILVGTHAVIEDRVEFRRLGMVVIDEQHRFGVAQRARLWKKSQLSPHVLVMTATPIPRTLAMTVYGDLDVSVIDELPPGRTPVTTALRFGEQRVRVMTAAKKQIAAGHQVYIVYPLVKENEKLDLLSVEEGFEAAVDFFAPYKVALVHGKMKPAEKDAQMELFATNKAQVLVATTVIEVGVNVPNATTMIIENAERFGLSQLHQLRGRVGRGADKSFCILMSKYKISAETRKRLDIMTGTTDGFVIAEADMQMRGPGDIEGTAQSGLPFDLKIANLAQDGRIIQMARNAAEALLDADPTLSSPENNYFARALAAILDRKTDWSQIS